MTDYARKMSLDLRMIDENGYSDHIDNKASHCAKLLNDYYQKYDAQKGTQFVFSDLGTYKPGGDFNIYSEVKRKLVEDYHIRDTLYSGVQERESQKSDGRSDESWRHPHHFRFYFYAWNGCQRPAACGGGAST